MTGRCDVPLKILIKRLPKKLQISLNFDNGIVHLNQLHVIELQESL